MRAGVLAAAAVVFLAWSTAAANAATITRTFSVTASRFFDSTSNATPPVDPFTAKFTLTWDPTVDTDFSTTGITIDSININLLSGDPPFFSYIKSTDLMFIHGKCCVDSISSGTDDFVLNFNGAATSHPTLFTTFVLYTQAPYPISIFQSSLASISVAGVPEPATWALGLIGFAGLGARLRGSRRLRRRVA
jgi:hypothetical protein